MLPDQGDPRRIGELLGDWMAIRMDEVDALIDEAESKVAVLPDQRHLWLLLGETLVRLHCLELEVAELRKGARR
jgi:cytochrome c-type biogenesis protein CcmH/NrfG